MVAAGSLALLQEAILSKNDTRHPLVTGLGLVAGALAIGAMLAEALTDPDDVEKPRPRNGLGTIQGQLTDAGSRMLFSKQKPGESLHEFLKTKYHGLYLLGRAGHQLDAEELDSLSADLASWHGMYHKVNGHDVDRALTEWYSTSGQSRKIPIFTLLGKCQTVEKTLNMPAYIAFCITGELPTGHRTDIDEEEWHAIKRHFEL